MLVLSTMIFASMHFYHKFKAFWVENTLPEMNYKKCLPTQAANNELIDFSLRISEGD